MKPLHPYIISGLTAAHFWLHSDKQTRVLATRQSQSVLNHASVPSSRLRLNRTLFGNEPYWLLVNAAHKRRSPRWARSHVCESQLNCSSIVQLENNAYIICPELSFCQMSNRLSLIQLISYGNELCSLYFLHTESSPNEEASHKSQHSILPQSRSLTTPKKLASYNASRKGLPGFCAVKKALPWVLPNAASPTEIKTMLCLTLPLRLGGYGLPKPIFNFRVNPGQASKMMEQSFFKIDICYPFHHVGVEFDSVQYHQDYMKDRRRLNALKSLGWSIVTVDKTQLYDVHRFDQTARQIAKLLGKRIRKPQNWEDRAKTLRLELGLA